MSPYYEVHITMETDPVRARAAVEGLGWTFSCIDGDPVLGRGIKCYATTFYKARKEVPAVQAELDDAAQRLRDAGCHVIRKKIELVVFDERLS